MEFTDCMRSSIQRGFSCGCSGSSKVKRSGIDGWIQMVDRPPGSPSGWRHDSVKLSCRRSLVAMTIFRCASARSSMWIGTSDAP